MNMINYEQFPFTGLDGKIIRKADGKKSQPHFHPNYLEGKPDNDLSKPIRYIRCGINQAQTPTQIDIFILDTDSDNWTHVIEAASQGTHLCKVISDQPGRAHFYFKFSSDLPAGKMVLGADRKLELFNGSSGVYGVTPANETKTIEYLAEDIIEPSPTLITLLLSLIQPEKNTKAPTTTVVSERRFFDLLDNQEFKKMISKPDILQPKFKTFLKLTTPKRYLDTIKPDYEGVIHPNLIPAGEGNNYLRDIRLALLQAKDVSPELTRETLVLIACYLWKDPLSITEINQMLLSEQTPDNYEPGAEHQTTSVVTKYGRQAFLFKVPRDSEYWIVELPQADSPDILDVPPVLKIPLKNWQTECKKWLAQETFVDPHYAKGKGDERKLHANQLAYKQASVIKAKHNELTLIKDRTKPGGINQSHTVYNEYPSSEFLGMVNHYLPNESNGDYPAYTINFLNNLAPVKEEQEYLLRFLKTFLTTNWKTSVILYFLGMGGTGKSTFIKYLTYLLGGPDQMLSPSLKEYLADKNGVVFTKTLIVHEEFSKQGTKADFARIDGIDKAYTGSDTVSIRRLYKDPYNIQTNGIILKTDNLNSVNASLDNRRVFTLNPKQKMNQADWHTGNPMDQLLREAPDFARFLDERVEILTQREFNEIPFESNHTKEIQMEEHEDDLLMQILILLSFRRSKDLIQLVRDNSAVYCLEITGRAGGDRGLAFSTLVKFVRTMDPHFTINSLAYYVKQVKEVLTIKDASLSTEVAGMPSKRDKRVILDEAFIKEIGDIT